MKKTPSTIGIAIQLYELTESGDCIELGIVVFVKVWEVMIWTETFLKIVYCYCIIGTSGI